MSWTEWISVCSTDYASPFEWCPSHHYVVAQGRLWSSVTFLSVWIFWDFFETAQIIHQGVLSMLLLIHKKKILSTFFPLLSLNQAWCALIYHSVEIKRLLLETNLIIFEFFIFFFFIKVAWTFLCQNLNFLIVRKVYGSSLGLKEQMFWIILEQIRLWLWILFGIFLHRLYFIDILIEKIIIRFDLCWFIVF